MQSLMVTCDLASESLLGVFALFRDVFQIYQKSRNKKKAGGITFEGVAIIKSEKA